MAETQRWRKKSLILTLQCSLMFFALQNQSCSAAGGPPKVQCAANTEKCQVTNFRGEWEDEIPCKAAKAFFPKTEPELIHAVAYAVRREKKIKVITESAHTFNRFACPGGNSGVVISTKDYNSRIKIDVKSITVTVDAGVEIRKLVNALAEKGLAFPQTTAWDGLSMAGVISTAAHGSGLWGRGGGIHEYVVGISIVAPAPAEEGYAKIIHLTENDEEIKAARVSLGVLGAISQVTFVVEKMFKRSVTLKRKKETDLENSIVEFAKSHEFGQLNWYPSLFKVVYTRDDRVSTDVPGNGKLAMPSFQPATVKSVVENRVIDESNNEKINVSNMCKFLRRQVKQGIKTGNGYLNDGQTFKGFPVVGYSHLMQSSSGCQIDAHYSTKNSSLCPWKAKDLKSNDTICNWYTQVKGNYYHDAAIAIPVARVKEAIRDLKKLRDIDPRAFCSLGLLFRFFKKSADYLSHNEDSVDIEFLYIRYREKGRARWNEDVIEEIEQMLLHKYGGVPHWGKNRLYTFDGAAKRTGDLAKFSEVKKQLDPKGYFSSEWSDGVLGIEGKGVQIWRDGCALDGLCICKEDRHCAPSKGFLCRAGKIWKNASVCMQVSY